jgi:catechol 2,3-dioxygenase-like lactoylglutathione lyase family enzyme
MTNYTRLSTYNIIGFVTIVDVERAKSFYGETLGLRLLSEERPFALVFDANGIMIRLAMGKQLPHTPGTVLGWQVPEIKPVVDNLAAAGVQFERYGFLEQDDSGIWISPTGARVAWFKDPDGNTLSVSEHPEGK